MSTHVQLKASLYCLILQHPQEKEEPYATAPLVAELIENSHVAVGLSWPNLKAALKKADFHSEVIDPKLWGVLFLGTQKSSQLKTDTPEVFIAQKSGNPRPDSMERLQKLQGLIALDGSWREAKTLWWRNPWLLKLNRIVLNPKKPSLYGNVRREPRKESVSTLEAISLTLGNLNGNQQLAQALINAFQAKLKNS